MTSSSARPLLFLDVDGPLLPFGGPAREPSGAGPGNPLLARLDPALGPRLLALGCPLVWATTWGDEANDSIGPRLGLPRLPVLDRPGATPTGMPRGLHWKTPALVAWAGRRPFVWVDDEIGPVDRLWVEAAHPAPALLHRVAPAVGLTDADFRVLDDWVRRQTDSRANPQV
ncbi:HAD domain-containing protein [Streptomyces sp. VRA16 Mangrove soil]|uniref:HAD domain-containing protein n=1 Tax=Streptomyces sp. VRA16 Mangrove soil TaxID=2817434 RepID=UPI001A9F696D|nr:HAD domain-containing protein [Streptomyces sp. VRA16 Mangrove soil]MBO1337456.1 hypothetical protein [Streptomyces sp. VRA16 Mangrove soil]